MKSKTSFFNKTIFFKNIRRFWLLPAAYLFCYIWAMPVTLYFGYTDYDSQFLTESLRSSIMSGYLILSLVYAVGAGLVTATVVFLYLQRQAAVNFFHALPSDRNEMFITNFLSGLAMLVVPALITAIISMLVCISIGENMISVLLAWLLVTLIMVLFFYLFAVICILISGQFWFSTAIYAIFLLYVIGIIALVTCVVSMLNIGCSMEFWLPDGVWGILSPVTFFAIGIFKTSTGNNTYGAGDMLSLMSLELITASIMIVVFFIIAYMLYKYRHSEAAGDTIAFGFAKPIFRWGFAFSFGLLLTVIMIFTVGEYNSGSKVLMLIFMLVFGILGFILAQMLVKKSVHVFKVKPDSNNKFGIKTEMCCFAVVMIAAGLIICAVATKVNKYVPANANDVDNIMISSNYGYSNNKIKNKEIISEILSLHHEIIDDIDANKEIYNGTAFIDFNDTEYIEFTYTLQNEKRVTRHYYVPFRSKAGKHLQKLESDPEYIVAISFGDIKSVEIGSAYLVSNTDTDENNIATYYKDAVALYEAMLADVEAGCFEAGDLYVDRYMYEIENKAGGYYDENGDFIKGYNTEIPFEYTNIDQPDDMNLCTVLFTTLPQNTIYSSGHNYYCVRLNEKCTHMYNVMRSCKWLF